MKNVHCVELEEEDSPTFENSSKRRIGASYLYTCNLQLYFGQYLDFTSKDGGPLPLSHLTPAETFLAICSPRPIFKSLE